jgi:hypothetical protein
MADRRLLTDRYLKALPPAPKGDRDEVWDSRLPGFGIRITDAQDADLRIPTKPPGYNGMMSPGIPE